MAGAAVGLGCSSLIEAGRQEVIFLSALGLVGGSSCAVFWILRGAPGRPIGALTCTAAACICCLLGFVAGQLRVDAIASGAADIPTGSRIVAVGTVAAWSRESDGSILICLSTPDGRLAVRTTGALNPAVGQALRAEGVVEGVPEWRADWFERRGIVKILIASRAAPTGGSRGGFVGLVDAVRSRSERSLTRGMAPAEAALAKGFVLGQDQEIPPVTEQEFRRSGLSHLLAVSGQNVVLLSILAWPFLALAGLRLRGRLFATAGLVCFYVLVTGAGPSIQRAGIMGIAGLAAGLAGRPSLRVHVLLLAAAATLLINPLSVSDPGWLLSFAATAGIMAWSKPLAGILGAKAGPEIAEIRSSAIEAAAVTIAATLATAPLAAAIFGTVSLTALPANLLALPAVAPAMWLGMLSAAAGQVSTAPAVPMNWLNSHCLGYIEQLAHSFGAPMWSMIEVGTSAPLLVVLFWAVIALAIRLVRSLVSRRGGLGLASHLSRYRVLAFSLAVCLLAAAGALEMLRGSGVDGDPQRLSLCALDVGQGDSILLDPPGPSAALVDTGPPGSDVASMLRSRGVGSLTSLILTHDQSDHAGDAAALIRSIPIRRLIYARLGPELPGLASASGVEPRPIAEGGEISVGGGLSLSVLWPPGTLLSDPGGDANDRALVLLARWRHFTALLTADAEAESVPVEPGPVDLLKVAHHGSEDSGLDGLLEHSVPKLALISVGEENSYGHPTAKTLSSLSDHQVPTLRTDRDGSVGASVGPGGWRGGPC